jgi:tRNA-splicing endonuclease subunit Sen15
MDAHPSYPILRDLLHKYPRAAGALFQTYNDISLAQHWTDVQPLELPGCSRGALRGTRPGVEEASFVVPCAMHEQLSAKWIRAAFEDLDNPDALYIAIVTEDSSLVYYKLSRGIVKPPV